MKIPAFDICLDTGIRENGDTKITDSGEAEKIEQEWLKRNLKIPAFAGMTETEAGMTEGGSSNDRMGGHRIKKMLIMVNKNY